MRMEFNGVDELVAKVEHLEDEVDHERLKARLVAHQLAEYQQQVATLIPGAESSSSGDAKKSYQLRVLASVVTQPDTDKLGLERAASAFERAKREFRAENFEKAKAQFKTLIETYPDSVYIPEAHFLLAESQYQAGDYENCIDTVESMVSLFPESDLTGFALLRLGKIYEVQDRIEDAAEIYKTVKNSYQDSQLKGQANVSLKAVEL